VFWVFQVNLASKQLEHTLNEFEQLFLNSRKFMLGDNISFADLSAICEIDQPSEYPKPSEGILKNPKR